MIEGTLVNLTPLDPANAEIARAWVSDPRVNTWMVAGHAPITAASELAFYANAEKEQAEGVGYQFEIHAADDGRLLGNCGLMEIDRFDRHGEVGIFIGNPAEHGKGFGRDSIVALLRFAFETIGLHTVRIRAICGNDRAIALYRSIGFKDVGTLREGRYIRGQFHDVALLDMTRAGFDSRYAEI
jgi:RimJ/RimL family protein N-acetyltransferase